MTGNYVLDAFAWVLILAAGGWTVGVTVHLLARLRRKP